jgi:phage-related protein
MLLLSGAIAGLTGLAVKCYAEFEQLAGGTELLFGSAYETVMKNAKEAYKTVQMSQNEYLRQVNGFAVGLKTSLGGNEQAAADLAHKIVVAEADIVAATGNTQENVQNAFNGIMKSNFTMLDNLQLGIKPTKEGMQEVIDKVNAWNVANGNATKYQMGNLADMQSAIVDYVEMQGMAGYASREAANTIQGSTAMMKASWENLLIAMSTGEGLNEAVDAFVDSLDRVVDNIAPVIERVLYGLAQAVQRALPALVQTITTALTQQIPALVVAVYNMIIGLFKGLVLGVKALLQAGHLQQWNQLKEV